MDGKSRSRPAVAKLSPPLVALFRELDETWKLGRHDVFPLEFLVFSDLDFELKPEPVVRVCAGSFLSYSPRSRGLIGRSLLSQALAAVVSRVERENAQLE
jgi:hypothetical protein